MPWGSRPSMAALTRSGARNASDIAMLILRTLHSSRSAMRSAVAFGLVVSSSSQRRPRAIDATNVARFSERIGRACCGCLQRWPGTSSFALDIVRRLSRLLESLLLDSRCISSSCPNQRIEVGYAARSQRLGNLPIDFLVRRRAPQSIPAGTSALAEYDDGPPFRLRLDRASRPPPRFQGVPGPIDHAVRASGQ